MKGSSVNQSTDYTTADLILVEGPEEAGDEAGGERRADQRADDGQVYPARGRAPHQRPEPLLQLHDLLLRH